MGITRRGFLLDATAASIAAGWCGPTAAAFAGQGQPNDTVAGEPTKPKPVLTVTTGNGDALQKAIDEHSKTGGIVRLKQGSAVTCLVGKSSVGGETSIHALLVQPNVELDLNGGTLLLDLRSSSYGIRLSDHSAIRNGTVRVIRSEGIPEPAQAQAIWHCAICVGAAYGDGGTVAKPGHFSTVSNFAMEDLTIEQPFESSCIQLMSQARQGVIRNIRILDSDKAKIGIGLDWGTVGPLGTADAEVPRMRKLWERNEIYSTHPHDILIENITIGHLRRNVDGNDAGVRCSSCYNIAIKNVQIESAATAIALFGGDFGYEVAPEEHRLMGHVGYLIDGVTIGTAQRYGIILNGAADNIYRAHLNHGYDVINDPLHPGLNKPVVRNAVLRGNLGPSTRGVYVAATTGAIFENIDVSKFETGVAVNDWVHGLTFRNGRIAENRENVHVGGATEPPRDVVFENNTNQ